MKVSKVALAISVLLSVVGCQSTSTTSDSAQKPTNMDVQTQTETRTFQSIQPIYEEWEKTLVGVTSLEIYAPENYSDLQDAWSEAQEIYLDIEKKPELLLKDYSIFSSQTYAEAFDERIAVLENNYKSMLELKEKSDRVLADSIAQIEYLQFLEADKLFSSNYKNIYSQYRDLFNYVLVDELENAQEAQVDFLNDARELEVKVVREKYITPLKKQLKTLKNEDFHEVAPLTFSKASSQIELAESKIEASPRDKSIITLAVQSAEFELNHVRNVAQEVKLLASVEDDKFEQAVLRMENKLLSISTVVNNKDYRDLAIRVQSQKIIESISELKTSNQTVELSSEVDKLSEKLTLLESENKKQAQQLIDSDKRSQLLTEQITRGDAHIKSLEELVSNLKGKGEKALAKDAEPATENKAEPVAESEAEPVASESSSVDAPAPEVAPEVTPQTSEAGVVADNT
ncbi:ATPase [Vibrio kagoshimensis]|uniref:ATPase n=1 Tax=Vibrio kagoshimensis TaxID=2910244 RepID=UPI003D1BC822